MRLLIAGSRDWDVTVDEIHRAIAEHVPRDATITEVVSGKARGADRAGERWAKLSGIPVTPFTADWTKYGKAAGPIRNTAMADYADIAIVFQRNNSTGSQDMIDKMKARGKYVGIVRRIG